MYLLAIVVIIQGLVSAADGIQRFGPRKNGNFGVVKGKILMRHSIANHVVSSPIDCSSLCISHPRCLSHDYKPTESGNKGVCLLNNASRKSHPADFVNAQYWHHYYDKNIEESRSCLDYLRNGASQNGIYSITDASGDSYQVFCDFNSEPRSAWTLILSFAFKNRNISEFTTKPLEADQPVNSAQPNWEAYRMSKKQMDHLSAQSTHFRATTSFLEYGIDYVDYMRIRLNQYNVLKQSTITCQPVEYINVRGFKGIDIRAPIFNTDIMFLHTDTYEVICAQFNATKGSVFSENNFGYYIPTQSNPKFRGCMHDMSTTEMWLGGYVSV